MQREHLDLRDGAALSADLLRKLDQIAAREYVAFNKLVEALSRGREQNIDWWVTRPATRNNHVSVFYKQCIQLALIRELLNEQKSVLVTLDSPELAKVLRQNGDSRLVVVVKGMWRARLHGLWRVVKDAASSVFHCAAAAAAARITRRDARPLPSEPLTLLGSFFMPNGICDGEYRDTDYPGLLTMCSESQRTACCYLPVFYKQRHYVSTFRALRKTSVQVIIREDYLGLPDYTFAFGHWLRVRRLTGAQAQFAGFEVGPLADADIRSGLYASTVVRALLAYRFLLNTPRYNIQIRCLLDWYEGLDINRATAAAINWHGLQIELIGFRSVGSFLYMSATPSPYEVTIGVAPRTLAMVGEQNAEEMRVACPNLRVILGPGFRYRKFSAMRREPIESGSVALLTMPIFAPLAQRLVATVAQARQFLEIGPSRWWVKCHPGLPQAEVLAALGGRLPDGFEFVDGDFYHWLVRADIVIGVASATLTEAVVLGIPTICLATGNEPTEIPVPEWVSDKLRCVAYGATETARAITAYLSSMADPIDLPNLQAALLSPATAYSARQLLGFETDAPVDKTVSRAR